MSASDVGSGPAPPSPNEFPQGDTPPGPSWRGAIKLLLGIAVVLGVAAAILLPAMGSAREAARRASCSCNLKQIGLMLHNYCDAHGQFPPAYIAGKEGKLMHSWRVILLEFIDRDLYEQYNFDEPWDGPNNSKLIPQVPKCYRCPSDDAPPGTTNYVAIVGAPTVWPNTSSCRLSQITDGTTNTIAVVEVTGLNIPWTKPQDLDFATMTMQVNAPTGNGPSSQHPAGALALWVDGSVPILKNNMTAEALRARFTKAGGEKLTGGGAFD